jgi:hypothetical protein
MEAHPSYELLINYAAGDSLDGENHIALCPQCRTTMSRFRKVRAVLRADDSVMPPAATLARAYSLYHPRRSITPASMRFPLSYGLATFALAIITFCAGTFLAQNSPFSISIIIAPKGQDVRAPATIVIGVPIHTPLVTELPEFTAPEITPTFERPSPPAIVATPGLPKSTDSPNQLPSQTAVPALPTIVIPGQVTSVPSVVATPVSGTNLLTTTLPSGNVESAPSNVGSQPAPANAGSQPAAPPPSAPPAQPPSQPAPPPHIAPPVPPKPPPSTWLSAPVKSP